MTDRLKLVKGVRAFFGLPEPQEEPVKKAPESKEVIFFPVLPDGWQWVPKIPCQKCDAPMARKKTSDGQYLLRCLLCQPLPFEVRH